MNALFLLTFFPFRVIISLIYIKGDVRKLKNKLLICILFTALGLTACSVPETTPEDSEISEILTENTTSVTEITETEIVQTTPETSQEDVQVTETTEYSEPDTSSQEDENNLIENMSLEEKVCQMFIVTPEELTGYDNVTYFDDVVRDSIEKYHVGGLIYFAENLESAEQTIALTEDIQNYALESGNNIGMFTAVDEEGGYVARVADKLNEENTGAVAYMETEEEAYNAGVNIAEYISKYGFNLDFAPVADVDINPENELGSRIFSDNPETVSAMSGAMVSGLQNSGNVSATLKHFPGLGAEDGNTHYDSCTYIDRTFDELINNEFVAFSGGINAGADFVMVGHQIMSCAEDNLPSDLSYTVVTDWLRDRLGFNGIIITDSHEMNTISGVYSSGESAVMAIEAGVDMVLMPSDFESAVQAVCDAVYDGSISEERINQSVCRILEKKQKLGLIQ